VDSLVVALSVESFIDQSANNDTLYEQRQTYDHYDG
jgi:hypothetical protein